MPVRKALLPLIIVFVVLNAFLLTAKTLFDKWGINREFVIVANLLFFIISILAFFIQLKGLRNKNPHAFVRSVMGSMIIRMMLIVMALVFYLLMSGTVNKGAVFLSLFLYVVYLVVEVGIMMKMNRQPNG